MSIKLHHPNSRLTGKNIMTRLHGTLEPPWRCQSRHLEDILKPPYAGSRGRTTPINPSFL